MSNICVCQSSTMCYKICNGLHLCVTGFVGQQLFIVYLSAQWIIFYSVSKSLGEEKPKQTFLEVVTAVWHQRQFTSFCCKDLCVTFWVLQFYAVCLFSTQQFSLFNQSDKIYMAVTLHEVHTLQAFLYLC